MVDDIAVLCRALLDELVQLLAQTAPSIPPLGAAGEIRIVSAPEPLPVLRALGPALDQTPPAARSFAARLAAVAPRLSWRQTYARGQLGSDMRNGYGWTELVGADGLVASAAVSAGLLLLGPHVHYPEHHHPALEHYLPLSGSADWYDADLGWRRVPPLATITHRPDVPHAMRTGEAPLLAYFHWSGRGVERKARLVDEPVPGGSGSCGDDN